MQTKSDPGLIPKGQDTLWCVSYIVHVHLCVSHKHTQLEEKSGDMLFTNKDYDGKDEFSHSLNA